MKEKQNENINKKFGLPFGVINYKLMGIGFLIIIIGFILMSGGKSEDPSVFNPEVFSFRRITLAPIIVVIGFAFEIYAIMKKPKQTETES